MGSIQTRTKSDGTTAYIARVRIGGKQPSKSFKTEREAKAWIREREGLSPTGKRLDNKLLMNAVPEWVEQATGSTKTGRNHLAANLGDLGYRKISDVTTEDVREWRHVLMTGRDWAGGKPFASTTVDTLTRHLSAFFNDLVGKGQIPRNPVQGARKGVGKVDRDDTVDPATLIRQGEVAAIIKAADEPVGTMFELMATSGLRSGEACGLRVSSVDFDAGKLYVLKQADGLYGAWGWKPLKSERSVRSVPLPTSTLDRLRDHVAGMDDRGPQAPLFLTERDYQFSPAHVTRLFARAAKKAGVVDHSPKSLRHFYASKLIRAGESVAVVQKRLGHASPMVTLSIYTHLWEDADDTTRAAVEGLF